MRIGIPARLAARGGCGYASGMLTRRLLFLVLPVVLVACDDSHQPAPKRAARTSAKVRSGAEDIGRKTEKTFLGIGGSLEKFFTGHDTISR